LFIVGVYCLQPIKSAKVLVFAKGLAPWLNKVGTFCLCANGWIRKMNIGMYKFATFITSIAIAAAPRCLWILAVYHTCVSNG
jgi:hypothetical protein